MKKLILLFAAIAFAVTAMAQKELAFPFQGGQEVMKDFFKNNFTPPDDVLKQAAQGVVILKFSADQDGTIKKLVVYYADDISLAQPAADLLMKANSKWIIPDREKLHDFIFTLNLGFKQTGQAAVAARKKFALFYSKRTPLQTNNQVPLDMATLLPTISITYDTAVAK